MSNKAESNNTSNSGWDPRFLLAIVILGFSIAGVVILAGFVLGRNTNLDTALQRLLLYEWPGNVRELENVVERSVIFSKQMVIESGDEESSQMKKGNPGQIFILDYKVHVPGLRIW